MGELAMLKEKLFPILSNASYAVASNLIQLIISTLVILVLPRLIGVEEYGFWQLYLFYVSYVGFAHLGWIDGIYLKYGGKEYSELGVSNFYSQFILYAIFQGLISLGLFILIPFISSGSDKDFILLTLYITIFLTNLKFFIVYILQITNRIKESSRVLIFDRLI